MPLTSLEKEWKCLHDKLGHLSFNDMIKLVENKLLPTKFIQLKSTKILCPSCIFGRIRKRAWRAKGLNNVKNINKQVKTHPGAQVSTDQVVVSQPGLVPRLSGHHTHERICGATVFLDHHSKLSYSYLQTSLNGDQTLTAKLNFESYADICGVRIKSCRADNGRFAEKRFRDAIKNAHQTIDFFAVGAHHQNVLIERHIQTLSSKSRTILLHSKRLWPSMITVVLWPYAFKYA